METIQECKEELYEIEYKMANAENIQEVVFLNQNKRFLLHKKAELESKL